MTLEYVVSNAGHPMLVIDKYTFHRHSSNPKTGRTNWRCSRRRVKDIRCPSSCNSLGETASDPTPHDPNCMPFTNAELMAMQMKRERFTNINNTSQIDRNNTTNTFGSENGESNNDCTISNIFNESGFHAEAYNNTNTTSNQDRELDDDDINNVIDGYGDENEADMSSYHRQHDDDGNMQEMKHESLDSIIKDFSHTPSKQQHTNVRDTSSYGYLTGTEENKNLRFVTSKVGHPMLVIDNHTFHKHSTNHKTPGRINWRCARRRVRDIRCSSSCFTEKGVSSRPTPHHVNCFPFSDNSLRDTYNKNPTESHKTVFGSQNKTNSFSHHTNGSHLNETSNGFDENNEEYEDFDNMDSYYDKDNTINESIDNQNGHYGGFNENGEESFVDYHDNQERVDDEFSGVNGDAHLEQNGISQEPDSVDLETSFPLNEYDPDSAESFAQLVNDLQLMKQREKSFQAKLTKNNAELDRLRKNANVQLHSLRWKAKMTEIDMASLKASMQQKTSENANLRKLVQEMMDKLNGEAFKQKLG